MAGKHKTGSTSFQRYLVENIGFFRGKGITVVENGVSSRPSVGRKPRVNCFNLAHNLLRPSLLTPVRLRGRLPIPDAQDQREGSILANRMLKNLPGEALLVSAESFSFLRTPTERENFDYMFDGFDVLPVVVFRDPKSWMQSWEKQVRRLKKNFWTGNTTADTIFDFSEYSWLVNDDSIRDFFGTVTCSLTYELALEKFGSIIPAILTELNLPLADCPPWDQMWENRTK